MQKIEAQGYQTRILLKKLQNKQIKNFFKSILKGKMRERTRKEREKTV